MFDRLEKPNFLVYVAFLGLFAVALNTVYLILPNDSLRWYLMALLVVAVMTGVVLSARHYATIGLLLDIAALAVFIYYAYHIYLDRFAFGSYLGEMLCVMLVLRSFKLFRYQDFLLPIVISLTLMVFSSIPSFSAEYVYSLFGFLFMLGMAMFLGSIDEFARLPRRRTRHSHLKYTYDFLEEYAPVPVSRQKPTQLLRYITPALGAAVPAVLAAFLISSGFYFTVDHTQTPGTNIPFLTGFGSEGFETDLERRAELLTGVHSRRTAQYYTGFDEEFNIAQGRLIENSTSTDTVMTVESNLPSYWRGKCFDEYTGRGWRQSEETQTATWSLDPPAGQRASYHGDISAPELAEAGILPDPHIYRDEIKQTFYLETDLPGIVFTAYQPRELSMSIPAVLIDDTFTLYSPPAADSMVSGQQYRVVSYKHFAQGDYLDANDYDPHELAKDEPEFHARYTQLPERGTLEDPLAGYDYTQVRARAYEVTAGAETVYQRVRALERHLESRYRYSLNPPAAVPPESDAVDYFLFDWEPHRGHCEYFSSSLAVLCRSIDIPARVVTGYATGTFNLLKNRYVVQERHAHAWVEVFWPDMGWVEFDPTPQSWYQGITERAASGWLVFHNAMENLYVYDPRGYFRDKIFPMINRMVVRVRYFLNQRELDFFEFLDPILRRTAGDREGPLWLLAATFSVLLASFIINRWRDTERYHREAIRRGSLCLARVRRQLLRRGVAPVRLATETDCALQAAGLSPDWGAAVENVVDKYQMARYSGRDVTLQHLRTLKRACRTAFRSPRS